jgi:hypothetical protein
MPKAQVFKVPDKTSKMLKIDLADAGIPYVDDAGLFCDFHSLRSTTASLLAASGTRPKVAQSIMRHADINLTMSRYSHVLRGQECEAGGGLPDLYVGGCYWQFWLIPFIQWPGAFQECGMGKPRS